MSKVTFSVFDGEINETLGISEGFCAKLFPARSDDFVRSRLPFVARPQLCLARHEEKLVGFKLAYQTADVILFSWLGGVLPEAQRIGVATGLMRLQHEQARSLGYEKIETRTRTSNTPMMILNLRHGFEIVGLEADAHGRFVVLQQKDLGMTTPSARKASHQPSD